MASGNGSEFDNSMSVTEIPSGRFETVDEDFTMTAGAEPRPGSAFWRTVKKIDKSKINNGWMALRNSLAVAVPLAVGIALGNPLGAAAVATGALNVSFSDGRDPYYQRARRMITWSVLGAFAVFVGCISGNNEIAAIIVAACWAFLAGMLIAVGSHAGDLGLNTLVALIVFAGRGATTPRGALNTGLLVLAGGLLQSAFCLAFWPLRRYDPERRALGHVYLGLAREVDPDSETDTLAPLGPLSTEEQETISALGNDHTVEGERFRLLFDQVDRLRLSTYLLVRLRDQLGERDDQRSESEGDSADLLDAVLRTSAKLLSAVGNELLQKVQGDRSVLESELHQLGALAQERKKNASFRLAGSIASAIDVLAGQLRLVNQLVQRSAMAETGGSGSRPGSPDFKTQVSSWASILRANLDLRSAVCRHAIRITLCIAAGDWIERSLGWHRAYWLPMTVAVVLKPDFTSTFSRGVLRLLGTLAGLMLATVLFHVLPVSAFTQLLLVGAFTFCLRYWGPANYGIFSLSVSGLVVFLIAATGNSPGEVVAARAVNTLAGGLLALLAYAVWPTWERTQVSDGFAEMIDASRLYLQGLLNGFDMDDPSLERERLEWRRARSNVEASVDRVIAEPGITALKRDTLLSMLASSHSLMLAIVGLEAGVAYRQVLTKAPALETFAHEVDLTLYFLAAALRGSKPAGDSLPQLREDHRKLMESRGSLAPDDDYVLAETDRLTVSLNTLREQVMRYVASGVS
jgi:uncharacterized membrane protein YccC